MKLATSRFLVGMAVLACLFVCVACREEEPSFGLAKDGVSCARLVPSGDPQVDKDISFFTNAFFRSTGVLLESGPNEIVFEVERRPIPEEDAYEITFPAPNRMRIRGTDMSCRWALNEILEKDMGVCFCFPGSHGTHYPRLRSVMLPRRPRTGDASLKLNRNLVLENPVWERSLGGKVQEGDFFGHNFFKLFPIDTYAEDPWREKLMPLLDGVRKRPLVATDGWQPCMASPESVDEAVKNILRHLAAHPREKVYSLSMNDNGGWCTCDGCKALNGGTFDAQQLFGSKLKNRSHGYYTWVNKVAERLAKARPDVLLGLIAYNEVLDPPPFPLHDNVVAVLCRSIYQTTAACRRASYEALLKAWSARCRHLGLWEYGYGVRSYVPPRMYLTRADEFLRMKNDAVPSLDGFFSEGSSFIGEGPKRWFFLKRAFDTKTPKDELLGRWYEACCGKTAAPHLKAYYDKWEGFWCGEAVRRTQWYASVTNGNGYCDFNSTQYLTALTRQDFAAGTVLMDKVVAAAQADGDADQRERARQLKRFDDLFVARATAVGLAYPAMHADLKTPAEAVAFLKAYPEIVAAETNVAALAEAIVAEKRRDPFRNAEVHNLSFLSNMGMNPFAMKSVGILPLFLDDPAVRDAWSAIVADPRLPRETAAFLRALGDPDGVGGRNWLWTQGLDDEAERRLWAERDDYGLEVTKLETLPDGDRRMTFTARKGWQATAKNVREFPKGRYCIYTVRVANPLDKELSVELVAGGSMAKAVRTYFPIAPRATRTCTVGFRAPASQGAHLRFYVTTGGLPIGTPLVVDRMALREVR